MKNYAMICRNRVIDVLLNQETVPEWPPDPDGNDVIAAVCDEAVQIGMFYDSETGRFSEYVPPEPAPQNPTQLDRIEAAVTAKNDEIAQNAIDNYTLELMEGGIL